MLIQRAFVQLLELEEGRVSNVPLDHGTVADDDARIEPVVPSTLARLQLAPPQDARDVQRREDPDRALGHGIDRHDMTDALGEHQLRRVAQ
jgi:hypothetical protein